MIGTGAQFGVRRLGGSWKNAHIVDNGAGHVRLASKGSVEDVYETAKSEYEMRESRKN